MADIPSAPGSAPVVLTFSYRLSPRGEDRYVASKGTEPPTRPFVRANLAELPPDLRARAAALRKHLPPIPSEDSPLSLLGVTVPFLDESTDDPAVVIGAWEALLRKQQEERDATAAAQRAREARAAEESRQFKEQMKWWVTDNGSEALRTAHARGYNVVGLYLRERVAKEFPGFELDTQKKAKWEDRANPSAAALNLETETLARASQTVPRGQVRIVWLTRGIDGTNYKPLVRLGGSGPQPREAVLVQGYLGRYALVRDVTPEQPR